MVWNVQWLVVLYCLLRGVPGSGEIECSSTAGLERGGVHASIELRRERGWIGWRCGNLSTRHVHSAVWALEEAVCPPRIVGDGRGISGIPLRGQLNAVIDPRLRGDIVRRRGGKKSLARMGRTAQRLFRRRTAGIGRYPEHLHVVGSGQLSGAALPCVGHTPTVHRPAAMVKHASACTPST